MRSPPFIYAVKAFRAQSREVAIIAEQYERDVAECRKDQASRVYPTAPRESALPVRPKAVNSSDFPIYEAQIWYADPGGLSGPEVGIIMPYETVNASRRFSAGDALTHTIFSFRDTAGFRWIRMPDGDLRQHIRLTARDSILAIISEPATGS